MEKFVIDRIEEGFAVLEKEDGTKENVKASFIKDCKEGDVVAFCDGEYIVLKEETIKRKKLIEEKMKKLFKGN